MATTNEYLGIDTGFGLNAVTFTADGEHLIGGSDRRVRMWRVNDGEQVATMAVDGDVVCLAASGNGSWIAGGTRDGEVLVWNARTHEKVFANQNGDTTVLDVDFSPNSTRLVSAHGRSGTATIWKLAKRKKVRTLKQKALVAKYSPLGDKIATATNNAVSIWGSKNGRLLIEIPVPVQRWRSLVWYTHRVFVQTSHNTIEQINASTGSTVSEWSIPDADNWSCVALSQRGQFLAYSTQKTIAFLDTTSRSRLYSSISHTQDIRSISWSSDGQLLAMTAERKIIVFRFISELELGIDSVALNAWKHGQLTNADSLLSAAIRTSKSRHHVLASRALVRARLGRWNAAIIDAEESIRNQQSVIGYIAKCATLIGKGEKDNGLQVCDIACSQYSEHVILLRLIEVVSLFMAGEHVDAISRMNGLANNSWVDPALRVVQAYMHLLLANKYHEDGECGQAILSFEAAQNKLRTHTHQPPLVATLVSGWCFDDLATTIHRGLCEALLAAGRPREAIESVQRMVDQVINVVEPIKTWVSEFKCRCYSELGDSAMNSDQYDEAISRYTMALSLNPTAPRDLFLKRSNARMGRGAREEALNDAKEWARLVLTSSSWQDALAAVHFTLEKSIVYRAVCEHLEMTGRITDAAECFHRISSESVPTTDREQEGWIHFKARLCRKLEDLGDRAMEAEQYEKAISRYTDAMSLDPVRPQSLLRKRSNAWVGMDAGVDALNDAKNWVELMLKSGSWQYALGSATGFRLKKFMIYRVVCEHLEMTGHVTDAIACFCQMPSNILREIDMRQVNWARDFKSKCRDKLEALGDGAVNAGQYTDAISHYTAAMSLDPVSSQHLLMKRCNARVGNGAQQDARNDVKEWVGLMLGSSPWNDALVAAVDLTHGGFTICRSICERLRMTGRVADAAWCFHQMSSDSSWKMDQEQANWAQDFQSRCRNKLEGLGDSAVNAGEYTEAVSQYTTAILLEPVNPQHLLMKRSNAWVGNGALEDALNDAKEWTGLMLKSDSWNDALVAAVNFKLARFTIYRVVCEHLETTGCVTDAAACLHQMSSESSWAVDKEQASWAREFKSRCLGKLEDLGDSAVNARQYTAAVSQYTAAMLLDPPNLQDLLVKRSNALVGKSAQEDALSDAKEWTRLMLTSGSWQDALAVAADFKLGRFMIYQAVCEHLEMTGQVTDAVICLREMHSEPTQRMGETHVDWARDFKSKCRVKLEDLGDCATKAKKYDEAVLRYTDAMSLDPPSLRDLLAKRSKACAEKGTWKDALDDANKVIELDPYSLLGHERKYAALHGMGRHSDATDVFETMLPRMCESSDPNIRDQFSHYTHLERTKKAIRESIQNALHDSPLVLIDTSSGRLCDKSQQASAFESTPAFETLVASMTTDIDYPHINQEVGKFYRYATLSHTWGGSEPLYEKVVEIVVYDLKTLPTHEKLKMFCKIVRDDGFRWAWSDTCCIDKRDHFVLQEALVSMFKWYEGSAMTIIFLCDVDRLAKLGALTRSKWNSRGWTLQEYHASKVVRIYTRDWTPYLGLTIPNHKESPEIISEMEQATGISAQALMTLRPGLSDIREKLRLASRRKTTRIEDAAYSLLGIFSTSLPVTYGERDKALGRLLSQLLMSSGDTSILAWSGRSGSFNSCLPSDIAVFSQPATSYIPTLIQDAEMATIVTSLQDSLPDLNLAKRLYDIVKELPKPNFAGQRMMLPCIVFKITDLWNESGAFHAQAGVLGAVEIKTRQNFAELYSPRLIYPWIDILLDQHAAGSTIRTISEGIFFDPSQTRQTRFSFSQPLSPVRPSPNATLLLPAVLPTKEQTRILRFIARLKQPFGALLLSSPRPNAAEYRRIATEDSIMVEVGEITPAVLEELIQNVRVLNVL